MPSSTILPINQWRVSCHSIIPHHNSLGCPPDPTLDILREGHVIVQELQEVVALLLLEPNNIPSELGIDVQRLFARRRMRSYYTTD